MKKIFISIILISSFLSCSNYQKILKSDDINFKYNEAVKYYKDADFNRAMPIFTELLPLFRGTAKAEELAYYYAYTHYSIGDYLMASYLFNKYIIN